MQSTFLRLDQIYVVPSQIIAIQPRTPTHCVVCLAGGVEIRIRMTAENAIKACGFKTTGKGRESKPVERPAKKKDLPGVVE